MREMKSECYRMVDLFGCGDVIVLTSEKTSNDQLRAHLMWHSGYWLAI